MAISDASRAACCGCLRHEQAFLRIIKDLQNRGVDTKPGTVSEVRCSPSHAFALSGALRPHSRGWLAGVR